MQLSKRVTLRAIILSLLLIFCFVNSTQAKAFGIKPNFGAGFGIPNGILGINLGLEVNIIDSIAIIPNAGYGTTLLVGDASNIGVRLLFGDKDGLFRFGFGYWSGTNTIVETPRFVFGSDDEFTSEEGISTGINLRFQFGRARTHGLDVVILKIITPTDAEVQAKYSTAGERLGGSIDVGVSYLYRF